MANAADHGEEIAFGPFRVDVRGRALYREGASVPLGARSFDILCVLLALRGNLATKDELRARVWPGLVVEENTLHAHVSSLRRALGDGSAGKRYIVTAPGQGYRFIGEIAQPSLPALPEQPSIAVLPFQNFDGELQDYFADGIVEEIITALTRFPALFVIARNSSFAFKGRTFDIRQVGRELGVRYVLEGSVRRADDRVRITGQLIEAATGMHLWADRFDGRLSDIFALQDEVTARIVGAIAPKMQSVEIERAKRMPTESLRSYDYYLRGLAWFNRDERQANVEALELFSKAIALDPDFAAAYGMAAWCYNQRVRNGWLTDLARERVEARQLALRAAELGREDAVALTTAGGALAQVLQELDSGIALIDRAVQLNPNFATAWSSSAWVRNFSGEPEVAIEHAARAIRLSPLDPLSHHMDTAMGFAHFLAGRYDEAVAWAEVALTKHGGYQGTHRVLAASHALAGRLEQARAAMARLRALNPTMRIADLWIVIPWRRPDDAHRYAEGLRLAGLPD